MRTLHISLLLVTAVALPATHVSAEQVVENQTVENNDVQKATTYIKTFFDENNNFDNGFAVADLSKAIDTVLAQKAPELQKTWQSINIERDIESAATFIEKHAEYFMEAAPNRTHISATIRETLLWEFVYNLLFSDNQDILSYTWNDLVDYVRNIAQGTGYEDIPQALPKDNEFKNYGTNSYGFKATARTREVRDIIEQHINRFPQTLQAKKHEKQLETHAQKRMQHVFNNG